MKAFLASASTSQAPQMTAMPVPFDGPAAGFAMPALSQPAFSQPGFSQPASDGVDSRQPARDAAPTASDKQTDPASPEHDKSSDRPAPRDAHAKPCEADALILDMQAGQFPDLLDALAALPPTEPPALDAGRAMPIATADPMPVLTPRYVPEPSGQVRCDIRLPPELGGGQLQVRVLHANSVSIHFVGAACGASFLLQQRLRDVLGARGIHARVCRAGDAGAGPRGSRHAH